MISDSELCKLEGFLCFLLFFFFRKRLLCTVDLRNFTNRNKTNLPLQEIIIHVTFCTTCLYTCTFINVKSLQIVKITDHRLPALILVSRLVSLPYVVPLMGHNHCILQVPLSTYFREGPRT